LPFYARVGWFERASLQEGAALLRTGHHAEAITRFDALLTSRSDVPGDLLDELYQQKILAHLDLRDYESIRRFVVDLTGPETATGALGHTDLVLAGELAGARDELREMATLYREDRHALLRLNRMFELLLGPRRLLARVRARWANGT